jgi:hypothetical protein
MSSTDDNDHVKRMPALLIGLGGTGMRTLRYVLWKAGNGADPGLKAMVDAGKLQTVAVDTDWKANRPGVFVEDYIVPRMGGRHQKATEEHRRLPCVPRMVTIRTEDISRAVQHLRNRRRGQASTRERGDDDKMADILSTLSRQNGLDLEECLSWLVPTDSSKGEAMSPGQARYEGAGQWRPLGRVGLFLEARAILDEIREAWQRVRDCTSSEKPVRAHIVCSLSGGTGSGTFWDIACMLRIIDPNCTITGSFLLADPFTGSDRAERIEANAYAALKELASLKNLQQSWPFEVTYPIGPNGLKFRREPGDPSIFDYAYIYQAFPPLADPSLIGDIHAAAIETSCFRLSENILTQLRDDVRARIDEGANNERSDGNADPGHRERSYVFSTSAVAELDLLGADRLRDTLEAACLLSIKARLIGRGRPEIQVGELATLLWRTLYDTLARKGEAGAPAATNGGHEGLPFVAAASGSDNWLTVFESIHTAAGHEAAGTGKTIERLKKGLDALIAAARTIPSLTDEAERLKRLREIYTNDDFLDPVLRQRWADCMLKEDWRPGDANAGQWSSAVIARLELTEILKDEAKEKWDLLDDGIGRAEAELKKRGAVLSDSARQAIERLIAGLDNIFQDVRTHVEEVEAPGSLVQLRPALDLLRRSGDKAIIEARHKPGYYGPVHQMLEVFATQLKDRLTELGNREKVRKGLATAFARYIVDNRATIKQRLRSLLEISERNLETLLDLADIITNIGRGRLQHVYLHPDGHNENFDRTMAAPLAEALRQFREEETRATLQDAVAQVARMAEAVAKDCAPRIAKEFQGGTEQETQWKRFFESMIDETLAAPDAGAGQGPFVLHLAGRLEKHFCGALSSDELADRDRFERRLLRIRVIIAAFVNFWAEQEDFVLARMGGEDGIRAVLSTCRSSVFGKGPVAPSIQQDKLAIGKPRVDTASENRRAAARSRLEQSFKSSAQAALNQAPMFCHEISSRPVIYFEQLFRSGAEILGIERYHQCYTSIPEEQRGRYHISIEAAALPDLIEDNRPGKSRRAVWNCTEPGHEDNQILPTEDICPTCMAEYSHGTRPLAQVRRRAKDTPMPCPGCLTLQVPAERQQKIPAGMIRFLFGGVKPSEMAIFEAHHKHSGLSIPCPQRSKGLHLLLPSTEIINGDAREHHHAYRDNGYFISTRDGTRMDHTCFHCSFPITNRQLETLRDGRPVRCPRCRRALRECPYCSHREGVLFQPAKTDHGPDRCPRCSNLLHRHSCDYDGGAEEGLHQPGFCRNIFGCPAGGKPWSTATEMTGREWCEACHDRKDPGLLLPWEDLRDHVERCPVCLVLLGTPQEGRVHRFSPAELIEHLCRHADQEPERHCVLCGTQPAAVIQWMLGSNYFDDASGMALPSHLSDLRAQYAGQYMLPAIDARNGIEFLELLWKYKDDRGLFDAVRGISGVVDSKRRFADLEREMRRLFTGRSLTPRVVVRRLALLTQTEDDIKAREEGRASDTMMHKSGT